MTHDEQLTFDQVAATSYEVTFDEVAKHYGGPMSKHPVISIKGHPEVIWVRPDMGVGMVTNSVAFAVGSPANEIPWREVTRSLHCGYLPIVVSTWRRPSVQVTQTAFAALTDAQCVHTGHESQVAVVEMRVSNTDAAEIRQETLWAFVPCKIAAKGIPPFPYNTYDLFEVLGTLPTVASPPFQPNDNIVRSGSRILGSYQADAAVAVLGYENAFRFDMTLQPGQSATVRFIIASSARGVDGKEVSAVKAMDFESLLRQQVQGWESILDKGTRISVPEDRVNDIYKASILQVQTQLLQGADKDYCVPVQGYQGVWPWEAMKLTVNLDAIGHHEDTRKCLEYFLQVQGRFLPHGTFKSSAGVFGGTIAFEESGWESDPDSTLYGQLAKLNAGKEGEFPNWMNGTGAMLYAFGIHYKYTRDRKWLERVAGALVRACDWVIKEREATKQRDEKGEKVLHFGLLPVGRAYDTAEEAMRQLEAEGELKVGEVDDRHAPLDTYYPCWTDSYSSQGLSSVADAFAEIGHPEGTRLLREAQAYRDDVLEVMRRTRTSDPGLAPYPERLYRPPAWAEFATGALSYLDTDFMQADSTAFEHLEGYMKVKWNRGILGLTGGMDKNGDPHGADSFYVNFSEDIWHRGWLLRGEIEKALLGFYSMLAYGLDRQTLITVERFHLADQRYAPFFMDTSASARICSLIRQAVLLEHGRAIHLLAGVPRRWLQAGKRIEIQSGLTTAAKLDVSVLSEVDQNKVRLSLVCAHRVDEHPIEVRIRVPHPSKQPMKNVKVNGKQCTRFDPERETIVLELQPGHQDLVISY